MAAGIWKFDRAQIEVVKLHWPNDFITKYVNYYSGGAASNSATLNQRKKTNYFYVLNEEDKITHFKGYLEATFHSMATKANKMMISSTK